MGHGLGGAAHGWGRGGMGETMHGGEGEGLGKGGRASNFKG